MNQNNNGNLCNYHAEHVTRISRNEEDIQGLWEENSKMKTWVILGMGSVIIQALVFLGNLVVKLMG